jgi:hypothetical protein
MEGKKDFYETFPHRTYAVVPQRGNARNYQAIRNISYTELIQLYFSGMSNFSSRRREKGGTYAR